MEFEDITQTKIIMALKMRKLWPWSIIVFHQYSAIFLKSPWYEDLKNWVSDMQIHRTAWVKIPHRPNICYIFGKPLEQGPQNNAMISGG